MRTTKEHISPGCVYCNNEHNPDIQCRCMPESTRFQLNAPKPKARVMKSIIRDADGKAIGVTTRHE